MKIDGKYLIEQGFKPGPVFKSILKEINDTLELVEDVTQAESDVDKILDRYRSELKDKLREIEARRVPLRDDDSIPPIRKYIEAKNELEQENIEKVVEQVAKMNRTPTVVGSVILPDACPTGINSMPVGTVLGAKNAIHPGWHSADICCSLYASNFGKTSPKDVLNAIGKVTHFGPGGRDRDKELRFPSKLRELMPWSKTDRFVGTKFFGDKKVRHLSQSHFGTQGDGNHFAFVGSSESTGDTWLVTHHGSRGFGARLYKLGMEVARAYHKEICPAVRKEHAWIPFDTDDGAQYWEALQILREWTKQNHKALHTMSARVASVEIVYERWNEHNFVFKEDDVFWHAKGATPIHDGFLPDTDGVQIIPLNMAQPILFVKGERNEGNMGFAPHGAGRNISRTAHKKTMAHMTAQEVMEKEVPGLDVRFWGGVIDVSELPSAYKDADWIQEQMTKFDLATVVDRIQPYGTIMAGQWFNKRR